MSSKPVIDTHIPDVISWEAYRAFARRTEAPAVGILHGCDNPKAVAFVRMTHAILGIDTELDELLELLIEGTSAHPSFTREAFLTKVTEEIGDFSWYAVIFEEYFEAQMRRLSDNALSIPAEHFREPSVDVLVAISRVFADAGKRSLFYAPTAKPEKALLYEKGIREAWTRTASLVVSIARHYDLDMGRVWATNIKKLLKRYSEKFDSQEAYDRDLAAEFEILSTSRPPINSREVKAEFAAQEKASSCPPPANP